MPCCLKCGVLENAGVFLPICVHRGGSNPPGCDVVRTHSFAQNRGHPSDTEHYRSQLRVSLIFTFLEMICFSPPGCPEDPFLIIEAQWLIRMCLHWSVACILTFSTGSFSLPFRKCLGMVVLCSCSLPHRALARCVVVGTPFVASAMCCDSPRLHPCLFRTLLEISPSQEALPGGCWRWGWEEAKTDGEKS